MLLLLAARVLLGLAVGRGQIGSEGVELDGTLPGLGVAAIGREQDPLAVTARRVVHGVLGAARRVLVVREVRPVVVAVVVVAGPAAAAAVLVAARGKVVAVVPAAAVVVHVALRVVGVGRSVGRAGFLRMSSGSVVWLISGWICDCLVAIDRFVDTFLYIGFLKKPIATIGFFGKLLKNRL